MRHSDGENLATARLELVPLRPADADAMVAVLGDERLYTFTGGRPPSLDELRGRYQRMATGRSADGTEEWRNWIIHSRADDQLVGTVQATIHQQEASADVAWVVGTPWQGHGFASEAAGAVVGWLEARGVTTITAHVHPDHHASAAVAAKIGLLATGEIEDGEQVWRRTISASPGGGRSFLRRVPSGELTTAEVAVIRELLRNAFASEPDEPFTDVDWEHALGGIHFVLELGTEIVAHASVVERQLHVDGQPLRTGYVEAVATAPQQQGTGLGTRLMLDVASYIRHGFELGALGTGSIRFYERLGWLRWLGPTSVRTSSGLQRTPADDGYVLVLPTPTSPSLDLTGPISCEWRPGEVW
jgi:RimJ/RimL family protein N-acetyltransferase/GNAT superfamily N-acetyltransferase